MSDNAAVLNGYTDEVHAASDGGLELFLLVKPDCDLGDRFKAWDMDEQEYIIVNGWLFSFTEGDSQ